MRALPFPTMLVASTNDPFLPLARAREFATAWDSDLYVVGPFGHIGSDSKLEYWQDGRRLLDQLIGEARHELARKLS